MTIYLCLWRDFVLNTKESSRGPLVVRWVHQLLSVRWGGLESNDDYYSRPSGRGTCTPSPRVGGLQSLREVENPKRCYLYKNRSFLNFRVLSHVEGTNLGQRKVFFRLPPPNFCQERPVSSIRVKTSSMVLGTRTVHSKTLGETLYGDPQGVGE